MELLNCVERAIRWLMRNKLKLSPDKTEWIGVGGLAVEVAECFVLEGINSPER